MDFSAASTQTIQFGKKGHSIEIEIYPDESIISEEDRYQFSINNQAQKYCTKISSIFQAIFNKIGNRIDFNQNQIDKRIFIYEIFDKKLSLNKIDKVITIIKSIDDITHNETIELSGLPLLLPFDLHLEKSKETKLFSINLRKNKIGLPQKLSTMEFLGNIHNAAKTIGFTQYLSKILFEKENCKKKGRIKEIILNSEEFILYPNSGKIDCLYKKIKATAIEGGTKSANSFYSVFTSKEYIILRNKQNDRIAINNGIYGLCLTKILEKKIGADILHPYLYTMVDTEKIVAISEKKSADAFEYFYEKPFSKKVYLQIAESLIQKLYELEKIGIVHRDIKPENILVQESATEDGFIQFQLTFCDFDFAEYTNTFKHFKGSFLYTAPEVMEAFFDKKEYYVTTQQDVWSLASVLFYIITKGNDFLEGQAQIPSSLDKYKEILKEKQKVQFKLIDRDYPEFSFLKKMLQQDPKKRIGLSEAIKEVEEALTNPMKKLDEDIADLLEELDQDQANSLKEVEQDQALVDSSKKKNPFLQRSTSHFF